MTDYVTLMLMNLIVGLVALAILLIRYKGEKIEKGWGVLFSITGLISLVMGLHMTLNWPIIGSYNVAFGEPMTMFGVLLIGIAALIFKGYNPRPISIYGFAAGSVLIVLGIGIIAYKMTRIPVLTGVGYFFVGLTGLMSPWFLKYSALRIICFFLLILAAIIFAFVAYPAYYQHLGSFSEYQP
jgi:putative membrane protein